MQDNEEYEKFYEQARSTQHQFKGDYERLRESLIQKGADVLMAGEIIAQLKKINYAKARTTGTQILLFGCLLLLIGFIVTCACYHLDMPINAVMYGFTSAGLLVMFIGIYYIFN